MHVCCWPLILIVLLRVRRVVSSYNEQPDAHARQSITCLRIDRQLSPHDIIKTIQQFSRNFIDFAFAVISTKLK